MTALDDRAARWAGHGVASRAAAYEWRWFLGEAHCYRRDQLVADWPPMLLPWCEENRTGPRRHERVSISERRVAARAWSATCPDCGTSVTREIGAVTLQLLALQPHDASYAADFAGSAGT